MKGRITLLTTLLAFLSLSLAACDMGGASLKTRARPVELATAGDAVTRVPAAAPFGITEQDAKRSSIVGGTAEADVDVSDQGAATLSISAGDGGEASASFRLGHAFINRGDRQVQADLKVTFSAQCRTVGEPPTGFPDATATLELVAKNRLTRAVRRVALAGVNSEQGGGTKSRRETCSLSLTFAPGNEYDIYLSGAANVATRAGRSAACSLDLSDVQFELTAMPAKPVSPGGDG